MGKFLRATTLLACLASVAHGQNEIRDKNSDSDSTPVASPAPQSFMNSGLALSLGMLAISSSIAAYSALYMRHNAKVEEDRRAENLRQSVHYTSDDELPNGSATEHKLHSVTVSLNNGNIADLNQQRTFTEYQFLLKQKAAAARISDSMRNAAVIPLVDESKDPHVISFLDQVKTFLPRDVQQLLVLHDIRGALDKLNAIDQNAKLSSDDRMAKLRSLAARLNLLVTKTSAIFERNEYELVRIGLLEDNAREIRRLAIEAREFAVGPPSLDATIHGIGAPLRKPPKFDQSRLAEAQFNIDSPAWLENVDTTGPSKVDPDNEDETIEIPLSPRDLAEREEAERIKHLESEKLGGHPSINDRLFAVREIEDAITLHIADPKQPNYYPKQVRALLAETAATLSTLQARPPVASREYQQLSQIRNSCLTLLKPRF